MLLDLADLHPGAVLDADVCVVGAGPAGISLARELAGSPLDVVVLESGGRDVEGETQRLYSGASSGTMLDDRPGYLATSRFRVLGGSANFWQGWCRRHDPIDYERREWVGASGWPIDLASLAPFYERAARICAVPGFDDAKNLATVRAQLLRDDPDFETSFAHVSPRLRFGDTYGPAIASASNVRLLTHANVVRVIADESRRRVLGVEASSLDGRRATVRARGVVLAAGGIENARLLLASGGESVGLGNDRDQVGRYFMEHPYVGLGYVVMPYWRWLARSYDNLGRGGKKQVVRAVLRPRDATQRRERWLNVMFVFERVEPAEISPLAPEVASLATEALQLAEGHSDPEPGSTYFGAIEAAIEPIPDPENRVTLGAERDALGMPRAELRWSLSDQIADSLRSSTLALAGHLEARLRGRVRWLGEGDELWRRARPSNHHMGTTRMAASTAHGVVDTDCRVHGFDNLWIAGSSVFPTASCSNPTLTLVALALRLADHLQGTLRG